MPLELFDESHVSSSHLRLNIHSSSQIGHPHVELHLRWVETQLAKQKG